MAQSKSGRIVIEVDPALKEALYARLKRDGKNLKEWFLVQANIYLDEQLQISFDESTNSETPDLFK